MMIHLQHTFHACFIWPAFLASVASELVKNIPLLVPRNLRGNISGMLKIMARRYHPQISVGYKLWWAPGIPQSQSSFVWGKGRQGHAEKSILDHVLWYFRSLPEISSTLHVDHQFSYVSCLSTESETSWTWHCHAPFIILHSMYGSTAMKTEGLLKTHFIRNFLTTFHNTFASLTRR